jgi:hypothetical protein
MVALAASAASAQERGRETRWTIEVHGGGLSANHPASGDGALPAAGSPFTTLVGTSSRRVSSWYFGDGAALLNQVNGAFRLTQAITPLDSVLESASVQRQGGAGLGFRVSRTIGSRYEAEFTLDYGPGGLRVRKDRLAAIEATRASFTSAWTALIGTGPFGNSRVTSLATIDAEEGHQLFTTVALDVNLTTAGKARPYVSVGAGVASNVGGAPAVALAGNYQFDILGVIPVNETDTVKLRYAIDRRAFVGLVGAGVKYFASPRWGLRLDGRAYLGHNRVRSLLEVTPAVETLRPAGAIASTTTPAVQFVNNPAIVNAQSSLGGQPISGFQTFAGKGTQRQIALALGVFWRF